MDRVLKDKQTLDKQKQDKLITSLSSTLTTAVHAKLDKLVKTELKNSVLPGMYVATGGGGGGGYLFHIIPRKCIKNGFSK